MKLFPHLETVCFTEQTIQFLPLIPSQVKMIRLPKECYCTISNDGIIHNKRLTDGFEITEKGFNNDTILHTKKIEMDFSSFTFIKSIKSTTSSVCFNQPTTLTHLDSKYFYEISSLKELHLQ
ncbi:hypothetical protein ENUP19_0215G0003 [Entamoeba nuttalli]|uniref:Leucine rich repeat protein, BspA family protein n=1 Tax=Entamoeba nuttalli TaxID=412467 RepID=A0ABQ0DPB1_9EUKA